LGFIFTLEEIDFSVKALWIQIHRFPLRNMTSANANTIGERSDKLLEVENARNQGMQKRKFHRVQLLNYPLVFGLSHTRQEKLPARIQFKYTSWIFVLGVVNNAI